MEENNGIEELPSSLQTMTNSISSVRQTIRNLLDEFKHEGWDIAAFHKAPRLDFLPSLPQREGPRAPFSNPDRGSRGSGAGDLVDSMIEGRIVLEKTRALEGKLRYQIEKLVCLAREPEKTQVAANGDLKSEPAPDPLAFRPNPQNLDANEEGSDSEASDDGAPNQRQVADGIYRPPRLAPVPYTDTPKSKGRKERALPVPSALNHLAADPSRPHVETTSGLGGIPQLGSQRATYLKRLQEFEEENFTRVVMKKSEARRRLRDEADLALGGDLGGSYNPRTRRQAGGLEDEFGGVLKSVERKHNGNDGYEELRKKGKKTNVLSRSRDSSSKKRTEPFEGNAEEARRMKKRSRFELEAKIAKKKMLRRR
ncbi:Neuroguidin-A [Leucoagaricus sp. SymC.cos]|nr:Neuroguidin-A [Leucoagaricus sp. SymC.cos]